MGKSWGIGKNEMKRSDAFLIAIDVRTLSLEIRAGLKCFFHQSDFCASLCGLYSTVVMQLLISSDTHERTKRYSNVAAQ